MQEKKCTYATQIRHQGTSQAAATAGAEVRVRVIHRLVQSSSHLISNHTLERCSVYRGTRGTLASLNPFGIAIIMERDLSCPLNRGYQCHLNLVLRQCRIPSSAGHFQKNRVPPEPETLHIILKGH